MELPEDLCRVWEGAAEVRGRLDVGSPWQLKRVRTLERRLEELAVREANVAEREAALRAEAERAAARECQYRGEPYCLGSKIHPHPWQGKSRGDDE